MREGVVTPGDPAPALRISHLQRSTGHSDTLRPPSASFLPVKFLLLPLLGFAVVACGTHRTTADSAAAINQQEANNGFSTGRVTTEFVAEGCPLLIHVDDAKNLYLYPLGLEEKYKRHGLHITFKYRPVKAATGDCRKGSPAEIEEVSLTPTKPKGE